MAEEIETNQADEVVPASTAPVVKKQRAARRSKLAIAAAAEAELAKGNAPAKEREPRGAKPSQTRSAAEDKPKSTRAKSANAVAKSVDSAANASAPALNEMAELLKLEEENKQLRRALADKLRAENADLRKRLGHS